MANVRIAYTGLRNPGIVRKITRSDFKQVGFPDQDELVWDQNNSWRLYLENVEDDLVDFMKEQPNFRVTVVGGEEEVDEKKERRADERAAQKTAAEMTTTPVDGSGSQGFGTPSSTTVGTSTTGGTAGTGGGTAGNGSST